MMTPEGLTRVSDAILAVEAGPLAREEGARLCQAYIDKFAAFDAATYRVLDVERPWSRWLDDWTLLVGQKDARLEDADGPLLLELKTHKEPRRTKAGEWYKGEGPTDWLQSISIGIQLGIYALDELLTTNAASVRVMVRAAVKSSPVQFWPPNEADGIFHFSWEYLKYVQDALLIRAAEIRAARTTGTVPWDWTGYKCSHMYGKECAYYQPFCSKHLHPTGRKRIFSETDPGAAAILDGLKNHEGEIDLTLEDPRLVILSASAYEEYSQCREKGRITQDGLGAGDDSEALHIGSVFHSGIAQMYREIKLQNSLDTYASVVTQL